MVWNTNGNENAVCERFSRPVVAGAAWRAEPEPGTGRGDRAGEIRRRPSIRQQASDQAQADDSATGGRFSHRRTIQAQADDSATGGGFRRRRTTSRLRGFPGVLRRERPWRAERNARSTRPRRGPCEDDASWMPPLPQHDGSDDRSLPGRCRRTSFRLLSMSRRHSTMNENDCQYCNATSQANFRDRPRQYRPTRETFKKLFLCCFATASGATDHEDRLVAFTNENNSC
jgi:hypothetical protein